MERLCKRHAHAWTWETRTDATADVRRLSNNEVLQLTWASSFLWQRVMSVDALADDAAPQAESPSASKRGQHPLLDLISATWPSLSCLLVW